MCLLKIILNGKVNTAVSSSKKGFPPCLFNLQYVVYVPIVVKVELIFFYCSYAVVCGGFLISTIRHSLHLGIGYYKYCVSTTISSSKGGDLNSLHFLSITIELIKAALLLEFRFGRNQKKRQIDSYVI